MKNAIFDLIERYHKWLRDKTVLKQKGDVFEITTPCLDRHNDYIQIYLSKNDEGELILSDDGETISDLDTYGCSMSPSRKKILNTVINGFGISLNEDTNALEVKTSAADFAVKKHSLLQAICAVGDMFYLASDNVTQIFSEDVKDWFNQLAIPYTKDIMIAGKSGFTRNFSFVLPKTKNKPERFIRPINNPNKSSADSVIMDWLDTKEIREDSEVVVIANDNEKPIPEDFAHAMKSYGIKLVSWKDKDSEKSMKLLAA